ncbi:MptD family putative ECF transporter S component, partial [Vibrio cholerae]|uniref:MptD family putative ECF transporter S component n=1 Tax=Vibrio cholerae TaxID=666 RepID=UPI00359CEBB2
MDDKKLKVKDLVSIGVFGIIYFVLMFGIGIMGMIPILFLIYPTVLAIVAGTVVMLFMTKVQKPWALFIF